jgi:hypothetical protein
VWVSDRADLRQAHPRPRTHYSLPVLSLIRLSCELDQALTHVAGARELGVIRENAYLSVGRGLCKVLPTPGNWGEKK